jgi:hypothetical protein
MPHPFLGVRCSRSTGSGLEGQPLHRNGVIWVLGRKPIEGGTMYISIGAAILILILLILFVF